MSERHACDTCGDEPCEHFWTYLDAVEADAARGARREREAIVAWLRSLYVGQPYSRGIMHVLTKEIENGAHEVKS